MLHIYFGEGKGKTSAAVGLAIRAAGRGIPVLFAQFLKDGSSGEIKAFEAMETLGMREEKKGRNAEGERNGKVPGIRVLIPKKHFGFSKGMTEEEREESRTQYMEMLSEAYELVKSLANIENKERSNHEQKSGNGTSTVNAHAPQAWLHHKQKFDNGTSTVNSANAGNTGNKDNTGRPSCLLVLDEIINAISLGFISESELISFLERIDKSFCTGLNCTGLNSSNTSAMPTIEIVLTGRYPSENLKSIAHYLTEMRKLRHPYDSGLGARPGIEK